MAAVSCVTGGLREKQPGCYYSENSVLNHICRREMRYTGRNTCYSDISNTTPWAGWLSDPAVSSGERALPRRQSTSVFMLGWILSKICETEKIKKTARPLWRIDNPISEFQGWKEPARPYKTDDTLISEMRRVQAREAQRLVGSQGSGWAGTRTRVSW